MKTRPDLARMGRPLPAWLLEGVFIGESHAGDEAAAVEGEQQVAVGEQMGAIQVESVGHARG